MLGSLLFAGLLAVAAVLGFIFLVPLTTIGWLMIIGLVLVLVAAGAQAATGFFPRTAWLRTVRSVALAIGIVAVIIALLFGGLIKLGGSALSSGAGCETSLKSPDGKPYRAADGEVSEDGLWICTWRNESGSLWDWTKNTGASSSKPGNTDTGKKDDTTPTCKTEIYANDKLVEANVSDDRISYTTGEFLTGHPAPYAGEELRKVETTPVAFHVVKSCAEQKIVVFGYTVKLVDTWTGGVIFGLDGNEAFVTVTNGEIVVWADEASMKTDIAERINDEIKNGNLSIHGPLAFKYVNEPFANLVPQDLRDARKVIVIK